MKSHIQTLERHNKWRRGADIPQDNPSRIGIAMDEVLKAAKRYEEVRLWRASKFKVALDESALSGIPFDEVVDCLIAGREESE